jgi:hypothetical protein
VKVLLRGELLGAKLDEKKESVFKTAETTCFGDAFSCLETKSFTLKTKENLMKVLVLRQLKASPKQVVLVHLSAVLNTLCFFSSDLTPERTTLSSPFRPG